jgi:hypothetical protein
MDWGIGTTMDPVHLSGFRSARMARDSSGVYICKSVVNYLRHGNFICKSEGIYLQKREDGENTPRDCVGIRRHNKHLRVAISGQVVIDTGSVVSGLGNNSISGNCDRFG